MLSSSRCTSVAGRAAAAKVLHEGGGCKENRTVVKWAAWGRQRAGDVWNGLSRAHSPVIAEGGLARKGFPGRLSDSEKVAQASFVKCVDLQEHGQGEAWVNDGDCGSTSCKDNICGDDIQRPLAPPSVDGSKLQERTMGPSCASSGVASDPKSDVVEQTSTDTMDEKLRQNECPSAVLKTVGAEPMLDGQECTPCGGAPGQSSSLSQESVGFVDRAESGTGVSFKRLFCQQCQKAALVCICASIPKAKVANKTKLVVLQHYKERKHPLGSVRFAKLGFENVTVVVVKELGSSLPWMKPPFSRKERARARARARALGVSDTSADTLFPGRAGQSESVEVSANGGLEGEGRPEPTVGGPDTEARLEECTVPGKSQVGEMSSKVDEGSTVEKGAWLEEGVQGREPSSNCRPTETGSEIKTRIKSGSGTGTESGAIIGARIDSGGSMEDKTPGSMAAPSSFDVRYERDKCGRKVRLPTFSPPPGIELTPGTAVLFPGPTSVDLLDAAEFWGLAVQASPFSPALPSLGGGTPAERPAASGLPAVSSLGDGASGPLSGKGAAVPVVRGGIPEEIVSEARSSTVSHQGGEDANVAGRNGTEVAGAEEEELVQLDAAKVQQTGVTERVVPSVRDVTQQLGVASLAEPALSNGSTPEDLNGNLSLEPQTVAFPAQPPDQLILIDGTWSKATRVFHEHGWLHSLPQYRLPLGKRTSRYRNLRKEPKKEYLSTLESGAWALQLLEPALVDDIEGVLDSFGEMIKRQAEFQAEAVRQGRCWRVTEP